MSEDGDVLQTAHRAVFTALSRLSPDQRLAVLSMSAAEIIVAYTAPQVRRMAITSFARVVRSNVHAIEGAMSPLLDTKGNA